MPCVKPASSNRLQTFVSERRFLSEFAAVPVKKRIL
jgi:hypothetical protein